MAKDKSVISSRFPYIPIRIAIRKNNYNLEALIDTGFNGHAILPPSIFTNGQFPQRFVPCQLADNSIVDMPVYIGSIQLANKKINDVLVIRMGDEPVIGREVIKHFKITLDHGRKIILER